jgi:hypothetical protein
VADLIRLELDTKSWERAVRKLRDKAPQCIARALNRAGVTTRTLMVRTTARHLRVKNAVVQQAVRINEARPSRLRVHVLAVGRPLSLVHFNASGPMPSRGRGRGVSATLPHGRVRYPRAFLAKGRSGNLHVFERAGTQRKSRGAWSANLPIKKVTGPSIADVFETYRAEGLRAGRESLTKNLKHEFRFALSQVAGGS